MSDVGIRLDKEMFFDRKALREAIGGVAAYNLGRGGSFVRQTARRSMRMRKKASQPGTPPSAHSVKHQEKAGVARRGPLLKDKLYYQYDRSTQSVVIGPENLGGSKNPVPQMHEGGGTFVVRQRVYRKPSKRKKRKPSPRQLAALQLLRRNGLLKRERPVYVTKTVRMPARPYMEPALNTEIEKGTLEGVWRTQSRVNHTHGAARPFARRHSIGLDPE